MSWVLLRFTLLETRRAALGWIVAIVSAGALYAAFFPVYRDNTKLKESMDALPDWLRNSFNFQDASGAGWLSTSVYGLVVPILVLVFVITYMGRVLAGDEEGGKLDVYLSAPLSRPRLVVERYASLLVWLGILAAVLTVVMQGFNLGFGMEVPFGHLVGTHIHLSLLGAFFGAVTALACGLRGRRGMASAAAGIVGGASFVLDALGKQFDTLAQVRKLSAFYYFLGADPLRNGLDVAQVMVLSLASLVAVALASLFFSRRDLGG